MDDDQVIKRVQWIEEERRKDKDIIAMMEKRLLELEGHLAAANQQNKDLSSEITRLGTIVTRMDQYDATLLQMRLESKRQVEELDKEVKIREEESSKIHRVEIKALDNNLLEVRKSLETLPKLEKGLLARLDEETRLGHLIDELRVRIESLRNDEEEVARTSRLNEDSRRQDTKRLNDLLAESTALRKRVDDQRAQLELVNNSLRKVESRLGELLTTESERREAQTAFLDKQALVQVERDRTWKDWGTRFQVIDTQTSEISAQLQKLESTYRETKHAQQILDELTQKVERRMTEITEIQRLSEDRFRQEWVTFKADDQKRWTNYTLIQEEQRNEANRQAEKLIERVSQLEDGIQEHQDLLEQINEQSSKRLQSLLATVHEWVANQERSSGRSR